MVLKLILHHISPDLERLFFMIEFLKQYAELWTFLISTVPVIELRGALPFALASGINLPLAMTLTIIGNLLPIPFILLFIRPIFKWFKKLGSLRSFVQRLEEKAFKKSDKVVKSNFWGLVIFVAIPLPGTGAWTGALIAALLDMRLKYALPAITLGVAIASVIVSAAYYLVVSGAAPFLNWILG